jgi:hypothetical protein
MEILDPFWVEFDRKAIELHKEASRCFINADYLGYFNAWVNEKYFKIFSGALIGGVYEHVQENTGKARSILERFRFELRIGGDNRNRTFVAIKKLGREDRIPEIEAAIEAFIEELADDFKAMANKAYEAYDIERHYGGPDKHERYEALWQLEQQLPKTTENHTFRDRLWMEDERSMAIMNKRKDPSNPMRLVQQIQEILN